MAESSRIIGQRESGLTEEWITVLPRRGKKNRRFPKLVIPVQRDEEHSWEPLDNEIDPERESKLLHKMQICLKKVQVSEFGSSFLEQMRYPDILNRFLKVLGSEEKMQMVIYGIGSIESYESPRLQLCLAILMKRTFDWIGGIEVFDPIISLTESKVLDSLGCSVLSVNEHGRRLVLKPTLLFMPHCEAEMYENLLEANWAADRLVRLVLFGNSFVDYEQHASLFQCSTISNSRKHMLLARSFTEEFKVDAFADDFFRAFHGSSWHFFSPITEDLQ